MSAELYDAEITGALARPAIDVLPSSHSRKDKNPEHSEAPQDAEAIAESSAPDSLAAPDAPASVEALPLAIESVPDLAPAVPTDGANEVAPRKVFGMTLTRGRKPKPTEAVEAIAETEGASEDLASEDDSDANEAPAGEFSSSEVPEDQPTDAPTEIVALAPAMPDHTEEVRAMRALLEASEQVRQAAESRTAAAESQLRTVTNTVQEWQIRHREAEATITELASSLSNSEVRMAELHQQVSAITAERDELVSQLDAATSPVTS